MLVCILAVYKYVVKVHKRELVDIVTQHAIHESLECAWGVTQAQRKHSILVKSVACDKGSFWPSARSQSNLVIPTGQVDCR